MQCVNCGLENPPSAAVCDCGHELSDDAQSSVSNKKCPFCAELIKADAVKCRFCGERVGGITRPIAGIAVAGVFAIIGLIWFIYALLASMAVDTASAQAILYRSFPGYEIVNLMATSLGAIGNGILLVGTVMAFLYHSRGRTVVRSTCWVMLAVVAIEALVIVNILFDAPAWATLDSPTKGGLVGGVIGGALGGMFQWGLILFLFRNKASKALAAAAAART